MIYSKIGGGLLQGLNGHLKLRKIFSFLMFSGDIERDQWLEMD